MFRSLCIFVLALGLTTPAYAQRTPSEDHWAMGRYNNADIALQEELAFAEFPFVTSTAEGQDPDITTLEGKVVHHTYKTKTDDTVLRVARNYETALARDGFEIVVNCNKSDCGANIPKKVLAKDPIRLNKFYAGHVAGSLQGFSYITTQTSWDYHFITAKNSTDEVDLFVTLVIVQNAALDFVSISQDVVETVPLETDLVARPITRDELEDQLARQGRATLNGLYFEFGTATMTDESQDTVSIIASYLKDHPDQKFSIVGHTDGIGDKNSNLFLSLSRSKAVFSKLTNVHDISDDQLVTHGAGEIAPVASNTTDEGRARNRRVELVLDIDG